MKKILYGIVTAITIGLVGLYVYAFNQPETWTVEHERTLGVPPDVVYADLQNLKTWPEWSSWGPKTDDTATWDIGEPSSGKLATASWTGQKVGEGRIILTQAEAPKRIEYDLWFAGREAPSSGVIKLTETKSGTTVTWVDRGGVGGNPLLRLLVPQIERQLSDDIERSLIRLDERL